MRDELGTVVHAQVARRAALGGELLETGRDVDGQALSGEFVDDVEHLDGAQVARLVLLKVYGPDDVGGGKIPEMVWINPPELEVAANI